MRKSKFEFVKGHWQLGFNSLLRGSALQRIRAGHLSVMEYACLLRQAYHLYRDHPPALARLTSKLRGESRNSIKKILAHAISEANHEDLALRDIRILGLGSDWCQQTNPLPMTRALLGFMNSLIDGPVPASVMGYFFHFEMFPIQIGNEIVTNLKASGFSDKAMNFFGDQSTGESVQLKLLECCLEEILSDPEELYEVAQAAKNSAILHSYWLEEAVDSYQNKLGGLPLEPVEFIETDQENSCLPLLISST